MNFKYYLDDQIKKHPSVMPQDIVKMCYQAAFGAEHLLTDIKAAEEYFCEEFSSVEIIPQNSEELFEYISSDFCRVNLAAWKKHNLPQEQLFEGFKKTAEQKNPDAENMFSGFIKIADETAKSEGFPFDYENWREFIDDYIKKGVRPVHHSERYRKNEYPSYRVISRKYITSIYLK